MDPQERPTVRQEPRTEQLQSARPRPGSASREVSLEPQASASQVPRRAPDAYVAEPDQRTATSRPQHMAFDVRADDTLVKSTTVRVTTQLSSFWSTTWRVEAVVPQGPCHPNPLLDEHDATRLVFTADVHPCDVQLRNRLGACGRRSHAADRSVRHGRPASSHRVHNG